MVYVSLKLNKNVNLLRFQINILVIIYEDLCWAKVENKLSCLAVSNINQIVETLKIFILFQHFLSAVWSTRLNNIHYNKYINILILKWLYFLKM